MEENKQDKKPERIVFETDDGPAEWYVIDAVVSEKEISGSSDDAPCFGAWSAYPDVSADRPQKYSAQRTDTIRGRTYINLCYLYYNIFQEFNAAHF